MAAKKNSGGAKAARQFVTWLRDEGYTLCTSKYPGAVAASGFVDDYLQDCPEDQDARDAIEAKADSMGWVSDYIAEDED